MGFFAFDGEFLVLVPSRDDDFLSNHRFTPKNTKNTKFWPIFQFLTVDSSDFFWITMENLEYEIFLSYEFFITPLLHPQNTENTKFLKFSI